MKRFVKPISLKRMEIFGEVVLSDCRMILIGGLFKKLGFEFNKYSRLPSMGGDYYYLFCAFRLAETF